MQHILTSKQSILVLCSDTVKEPAAVSSHIRVSKQPFYYTGIQHSITHAFLHRGLYERPIR